MTKYKRFKSFTYVDLPLIDNPALKEQPVEELIEKANDVIDKKDTVAFVHCMQGVSRSGMICVAYLIHQSGFELKYDDALKIVKKNRPLVRPNAFFEDTVKKWRIAKRRQIREGTLTLPQEKNELSEENVLNNDKTVTDMNNHEGRNVENT
eukprot:UN15947